MKKMAIKGLVTLAAVVALCMFFSGTIKTISTAKVKLVTAKQGKLEEEIKLSGNLTFPQTEDVKLALTSDPERDHQAGARGEGAQGCGGRRAL